MKLHKFSLLGLLIIMMMLVSACGGDAATTVPAAVATDTPAAAGAAATNTTAPAPAAATDTPAAAGAAATATPAAAAAATDTPAAAAGGAAATDTPAPTATAAVLGASDAKTTITIWHQWAANYFDAKQAIFADYVKAHPDVKINLLNVSDIDKKMQNAVPAGAGPDIAAWVDDHIGQNALLGVIDPIDGIAGVDKAFLDSTYLPVASQAVTYDGKIYALPETVETLSIIYNKKLITEDKLPKNTTELLANMKSYNAANPGKYYAVWNAKSDAYFNAWLMYGAGGQYVDEKGAVGLNSTAGVATASYVQSLADVLPKDVSYDVADALFKDGKAAMIINGPWYIEGLTKANMDFGMAKLPAIDFGSKGPARPFVGVKCLMLAHGSKNQAVAVDIMKYYTAHEQETKMVKATGEVPANKAAGADVASNPVVTAFNTQALDGVPLPNTPFMNALWDPAGKAFTAAFSTKDDPKKIMDEAQKAAEDAVAKMK
jgi:arabinogalactan oligomer / maltooligosaccharide transport system substrate-binding protein